MIQDSRQRRMYWVAELARISGTFGDNSAWLIAELRSELSRDGHTALLDHLRLCGAMPEQYGHDSTEEKLYSKYTDAVLSEALTAMGLHSTVITARSDAADVQARAADYSLVADAKAFRLSRTAKNQKDFKVQAIDGWRGGLDYAVVVCPIYQLPARNSQIYQQAISRNVCLLSYSHLAALVALSATQTPVLAAAGLRSILTTVTTLHPTKSSVDYWTAINRALLQSLSLNPTLWSVEKTASLDALTIVKDESLRYLRTELDRLLGLSHQDAISELVRRSGMKSRIEQVERVTHGTLLGA